MRLLGESFPLGLGMRHPSLPRFRFPCGSAGGSNDYPYGCTSPCPARFCGTLRTLSQRGRATPRLPMWQYP